MLWLMCICGLHLVSPHVLAISSKCFTFMYLILRKALWGRWCPFYRWGHRGPERFFWLSQGHLGSRRQRWNLGRLAPEPTSVSWHCTASPFLCFHCCNETHVHKLSNQSLDVFIWRETCNRMDGFQLSTSDEVSYSGTLLPPNGYRQYCCLLCTRWWRVRLEWHRKAFWQRWHW